VWAATVRKVLKDFVNSIKPLKMKVPQIRTTDGLKSITILPDEMLVEWFLYDTTNAAPEDVDLVQLLNCAEPDAKKNGAILRQCLEGKARLLPVYPGIGEKEPNGAKFVGSIIDGGLYLVPLT
jgi:hypothetical protein